MPYEQILYEVDDHVLHLTCNRPRYRNAHSRVLLEELDHAFARAAEDLDIRVIVLMGSGDHFSAGHDLGTSEEMADREKRPRQEGIRGRFNHSREQFVDKTLHCLGHGYHLRRRQRHVSWGQLSVFFHSLGHARPGSGLG
ncbi:hypothetical protein C2W62_08425 [Candidatus Entotheonella serta]|nr:hypothetical protein C2W62_08425 [Candidatus Entotheonella serta]